MLKVYYSNQLATHRDLLVRILSNDPNPDPFVQEIVLVQSSGMAQWLQMEIASHIGVSGNIQFPYPTSFVWQQYRTLFPDLPKENIFSRTTTVWRLMRLIPALLNRAELSTLAGYLKEDEPLKLYQLAQKIADLFDQYLVYRPQWLIDWEAGNDHNILKQLLKSVSFQHKNQAELENTVRWQGILWNALVEDIKQDTDEMIFNTSHRAYLQRRYFERLENISESEQKKLPHRIFVFGISSLPLSQLAVLQKLSEYCTVHLFFTNPSQDFWGEQQDERILEKLVLKRQIQPNELEEYTKGNPLLAVWGKQGKEFFNLLEELEPKFVPPPVFEHFSAENSLLATLKQAILENQPILNYEWYQGSDEEKRDYSIQIHSCHSKMREVEVLHNHLLAMFEDRDHKLSPKDIIVMSPDIDSYAPYINAVFSRYHYTDPRYIPFSLSDQKVSHIDPIVASFLNLLSFKEKRFSVEEIFDLLNVVAIREKYQISEEQLFTLREWVDKAGIRAGLALQNPQWQNYTSWENGVSRLLLGTALKEENQPWQDVLGFDESYGLNSELSGNFAHFLQNLTAWHQQLQQLHSVEKWQEILQGLLTQFYCDEIEQSESLLLVRQAIELLFEQILQGHFDQELAIEILAQQFEQHFADSRSNLNFMVGKVNFCTLLPMRAIPFQVVCLLGMNEGEFPRQQTINNFDLMQYDHQKGDRAKRDDDRYLFLESLLSAQKILYISYIGQSLTDNQEKLPSILVSQLQDYIAEQLSAEVLENFQYKHPMTVFSPNNFVEGAISYDQEWLRAKTDQALLPPFLTKLDRDFDDFPDEVELEDLIAYLQDPVRFFFNRHLGIYFEQYEKILEPHEVFQISGLERYALLDDLVELKASEQQQYFTNAKLKGKLPNGHFGELSLRDIREQVMQIQETLSGYLSREKDLLEIDYAQPILSEKGDMRAIRVQGYIPNYFGDKEIVQWRVGQLRDKDLIKAWVYQLFLIVSQQKDVPFSFYFFDKKVKKLQFIPLAKQEAERVIQCYLQDYFANFSQLTTALTHSLQDYFKELPKIQEGGERDRLLQTKLESIYWNRVAQQSPITDFENIHQRTVTWFEEMMKSQEIQ